MSHHHPPAPLPTSPPPGPAAAASAPPPSAHHTRPHPQEGGLERMLEKTGKGVAKAGRGGKAVIASLLRYGTYGLHLPVPVTAVALEQFGMQGTVSNTLESIANYTDLDPVLAASIAVMHAVPKQGAVSYCVRAGVTAVATALALREGVELYQAVVAHQPLGDVAQQLVQAFFQYIPAQAAWRTFTERNHPSMKDLLTMPFAHIAHIAGGAAAWFASKYHNSTIPTAASTATTYLGELMHNTYATAIQLCNDAAYVGRELHVNPVIAGAALAVQMIKPKGWIAGVAGAALAAVLGYDIYREALAAKTAYQAGAGAQVAIESCAIGLDLVLMGYVVGNAVKGVRAGRHP